LVTAGPMISGFPFVISVSMSVLAILTHMYMTVVVLDVCMSNNRVTLNTNPLISFGESNKAWLKFRNKKV
jgi:hypothetical protein